MRLIKIIALLAFICAPAAHADADAEAMKLLAVKNKVIAQLSAHKEKNGSLSADDILPVMRADISPKFNFEQLTKRAMGKHWKRADADLQQQITDAFRNLMEKTYAKVLEKYDNEKVTLVEASTLQSGNGISVLMEISGDGKSVQIDYILSPDDGGAYRIVDIKVEKISLLANYRRQFAQIIRKSKVEGLLVSLHKQAPGK